MSQQIPVFITFTHVLVEVSNEVQIPTQIKEINIEAKYIPHGLAKLYAVHLSPFGFSPRFSPSTQS